jgi:hypothetical protein
MYCITVCASADTRVANISIYRCCCHALLLLLTVIAGSGFGETFKVQPLEQFRLSSHTSSREKKPETAMKLL